MLKKCNYYIKKIFRRNRINKNIYKRLVSSTSDGNKIVNSYELNILEKYNYKKLLFKNSTTKILLVSDNDNDNDIVLKLVLRVKNWYNEVKTLKSLNHKNIIKIGTDYNLKIDTFDLINLGINIPMHPSQNYNIIPLQYYKNGDLYELLIKNNYFNESICRFFLKPIIEALVYSYNKGITHNDVKLENILIDDDFNSILCDWGYSKKIIKNKLSTNFSGTTSYMAPEMISSKFHDPSKSNSWAFGITLFSLCFGVRPYTEPKKRYKKGEKWEGEWLLAIKNKQWEKYWLSQGKHKAVFLNMSHELKNLFENIFIWDFRDRYSVKQILDHEWMHLENDKVKTLTNDEVRNKILI